MVATATPVISNVLEGDARKRKQTLERTRCGHLCRQLQMRLQYARLKVEHGWEKQSLNEVENLYFHHSHLRGTRQLQSNAMTAVSQPEAIRVAQPRASAAHVEAGVAASTRSANPYTSLAVNSARSSATPSSSTAGQMLPPSSTPTPTPIVRVTPPPVNSAPPQSFLPSPKSPLRRKSTPQTTLQSPVTSVSSTRHPQYSYSVFPAGTAPRPPGTTHQPKTTSSTATPPPAPPNVSAEPAQSKGATSSTTKTTPGATAPAPTATFHYYKQEPFNFGSMPPSGLTYEGFWSNHLSSSPRTNQLRQSGYSMLSTPAATPTAGPSNLGQQAPA